ncbi:MAG: insulinase family protein [Sphingomonadales bacterium]|nr:insulinase family protein [Sphingomonadales bacterium]
MMPPRLLASLALAAFTAPAFAQSVPQPAPAPLATLVQQVDIPYDSFTLPNGLRVLVHTDRKAPVVGVTLYYRVGSKNEPRGRTGFAHLYEHLFFGGSADAPSFDVPLEAAGAGGINGSTWYDRTNYVETVPKGALALALFLESDRMGHLLPAVSQDKLDKQRGVVENEKRQDDNQPYGLVQYAIGEGLFPVGHPYRHATIGSMADINAATLGDVRAWFTDHYAPDNVILALTGDIDARTARPLVERYFGDIPAGPRVQPVVAGPVTLAAPVHREMTDQVGTLRLYRVWSAPGLNDHDTAALEVAMRVLGGLASSRLDNDLVRGRQLAVDVSADDEDHEQVSMLTVSMDVRPGVPRATAEAAFDDEIRRFIAGGPTADELRRAATMAVTEQINALEVVGGMGGKGATLAEGLLFSGDPAHYRKHLEAIAALTPADVRAALQRWLTRPPVEIAVTPGERTESGNTMGGWGDEASHPAPPPDPKTPVPPIPPGPPRIAPPVAPIADLTFPAIAHARLANGIPVALARRSAVPTVLVSMMFDAGIAADAQDGPGTQSLMLRMLDQGAQGPNGPVSAAQIAADEERLGASIAASPTIDTSQVALSALTANLAPSLELMRAVVRAPSFAAGDVARIKAQRLAELDQALASPQDLAIRSINPLLYGAGHPYAQPGDGLGTAAALATATPQSLRAAHDKWLRPDLAQITVVGDITMDRLLPLLNAAFGDWRAPSTPPPVKPIDAPVPAPRSRIVVIDHPHAQQSVIVAGRVLPIDGRTPNQEAVGLANDVLGADFLSRLNSDLREDKGWSYGVQSVVREPIGPRSLLVFAPVEADRTGDSIKAIIADMTAFPAARPVGPAELQRATEGTLRSLPDHFQTNAAVLGAIQMDERLGRPDDYYATLPARYRALDAQALDQAAARFLQPDGLIYVVVGDRKVIEPQLAGIGLPVEYRSAAQ